MEQFLENKYVFWIITAVVGGLFALVITLITRRITQLEDKTQKNTDKINEIIANLPIQYTLRDEFLRVTSEQGRKLDKISDNVMQVSQSIAVIMQFVKGGNKCGDQQD